MTYLVHTYGPAWDCIDLSPFSIKLQTWLRLAGLPFETRISSPQKMPQHKLPVLALADGQLLPDSGAIIERLRADHGDPLRDAAWPAETRAAAQALRALLESEAYFVTAWWRWADAANAAQLAPVMQAYLRQIGVPGWLAPLALRNVRGKMLAQLNAQGMGRRTPEAIAAIGINAYSAVADWLQDRPFMLGEQPSTLDATVFGFLHALLVPPLNSPVKAFAARQPRLVAYHQRMLARAWPERA